MKIKSIIGIWLTFIMLAGIALPTIADTLTAPDFAKESWEKTIDYFDYARAYALLHGIPTPSGFSNWHAPMYMTYVNTKGLQMLYAGLINVSFGGALTLTIPMQTVMMHYKTENTSQDVLIASSFLMLLAFNETGSTLYTGSPDINDRLWSSFSMGFNFGNFTGENFPALHSKTEITPLTHSDDNLTWTWGMRYTNLTSIWWRTYITPTNPHFENSFPMAIATYDELNFTYKLTISPETHTATLSQNYVIGRVRDLWHFGWFIIPWCFHYNSTGCYQGNEWKSNITVHDFLKIHEIKMSIVNFQTSVMLQRETSSISATGQNVTDNDVMVSDSHISTYAENERIFDTIFGTKKTYNLYNYTKDPTETTYDTYNATSRTCKINGFAGNTALFDSHIKLMKYLPYLVGNMRPQLYDKAKDRITNMTKANYFYLIGYPTYSGYRVEHDPTLKVYLTTSETEEKPFLGAFLIIAIAGSILVLVLAVLLVRRKKPQQPKLQST
ncbi:hypothetical protein KEJ15_03910 [Candidatus Bathyarchaeota archaeon]|nr:hypothetical protein [Candidatus Bathyarchaeota archaeon]